MGVTQLDRLIKQLHTLMRILEAYFISTKYPNFKVCCSQMQTMQNCSFSIDCSGTSRYHVLQVYPLQSLRLIEKSGYKMIEESVWLNWFTNRRFQVKFRQRLNGFADPELLEMTVAGLSRSSEHFLGGLRFLVNALNFEKRKSPLVKREIINMMRQYRSLILFHQSPV